LDPKLVPVGLGNEKGGIPRRRRRGSTTSNTTIQTNVPGDGADDDIPISTTTIANYAV
jgi:hypothetical protein